MEYPLRPRVAGIDNGDRVFGEHLGHKVSWQPYTQLEIGAGAGITDAAAMYRNWVERKNSSIIETHILIDLTGLRSTAGGDIIGDDGAGTPCYLGMLTDKCNGDIFAGRVDCLEVPAGGDPDIDLYIAVEATGVEDAAITTLDETILLNAGDHAANATKGFAVTADCNGQFLYLVAGATTNADYTTGILHIILYGSA